MIRLCTEAGHPEPDFLEFGGCFTVRFFPIQASAPQVTPQVKMLVAVLRGEMSREELMTGTGIHDRKHFRVAFLQPALESGLVEMTRPDKPNSSQQRYRLTSLGQNSRPTPT